MLEVIRKSNTEFVATTRLFEGYWCLFHMPEATIKYFMEVIIIRFGSLEVQTLDLVMQLYFLVPNFLLKYILWLKHFQKHWICCCYCIPWVPSFRLICLSHS